MIEVQVGAGMMEKILGEGLRVLMAQGVGEGEQVRLAELNGDEATGRTFYGRVMHDMGDGVVQIDLAPFMEAVNEETGKPERIPMAGEFSNEKYVTPSEEWKDWQCAVKGERPIWIYKGIKWIQEISLAKLFFGGPSPMEFAMNKMAPPHTLHVKIQAQGGEKTFKYSIAGEVA